MADSSKPAMRYGVMVGKRLQIKVMDITQFLPEFLAL
jgi:hypothetical protein